MRNCKPGCKEESGELFCRSLLTNAQKLKVHCFNCWTQRLSWTGCREIWGKTTAAQGLGAGWKWVHDSGWPAGFMENSEIDPSPLLAEQHSWC